MNGRSITISNEEQLIHTHTLQIESIKLFFTPRTTSTTSDDPDPGYERLSSDLIVVVTVWCGYGVMVGVWLREAS